MQEYNTMLENLRSQGIIPETPPPRYKLNASIHRPRISILHPTDRGDDAPPMYEEYDNQNGQYLSEESTNFNSVSDVRSIEDEGFGNPGFADMENDANQRNMSESGEENPNVLPICVPVGESNEHSIADAYYREFRLSLGEVTHL